MNKQFIARSAIFINATKEKVFDALISPEAIKQYMFGTTVISDWKQGSPIIWKGEWQGKKYEDKGTILQLDFGKIIQYTHYSPVSGLPDTPENYHTVTFELSEENSSTKVILTQDNSPTEEERDHSEENWNVMLNLLKQFVENRSNEKSEPKP